MEHYGLTNAQATKLLLQYGRNEIVERKKLSGIVSFFLLFTNPLILILLVASGFSAFLGDVLNASIIGALILLSVVMDFLNTYRSERIVEKLKAQVLVTAAVIRDGKENEIPLVDIVPGDAVFLTPGDIVPADGIVLEAKNFFTNESSLTGESFPVSKEKDDSIFMGTSVTTGEATILVKATGKSTRFSKIAEALTKREMPTEFDRTIRNFSYLVMKLTVGLVIAIFFINVLTKSDILESLMFALALAVGLTPELLPLIITLNLSKGALNLSRRGIVVKKLSAVQNFGGMNILCSDKTGTLTEDKIVLVKHIDIQGNNSEQVFLYSYLASSLHSSIHNPLDTAIQAFKKLEIKEYKKIDELPFDYKRKRDTVVVKGKEEVADIVTRGSPDEILSLCKFSNDGKTKLTASLKKQALSKYESLSQDGFRVLGVALRKTHIKAEYGNSDEFDMSFLGFIAFLDPAKTSVTKTLQKLEKFGIEIKILTGDNELVSGKIANDIKLPVRGIMVGPQILQMSDEELMSKAGSTTIFARVSPDQKSRIIDLLQKAGNVVGFMGDGINDAPSLKAADIGISVNNAVDIAKESADLIMLNKNLDDLIEGVMDGRKTFVNTMKYLMMEVSSNFGNMFSMAGASALLPFLPMLPIQILFNNLLYEASQFSVSLDNVDDESIRRPVKFNIGFLKKFVLIFGPVSSIFDFLTFFMLFVVFHFTGTTFQTGWFLESIATQSLVIFLIRTRKIPFLESRPSATLLLSMTLTVVIGWGIVYTPIAPLLKLNPLPPFSLLIIVVIVAMYLFLVETVKRQFYRLVKVAMV
ncbi:MAG: magnesium-translocating P-type ATPase [Candidatus Pacebacteria bacterium]|nr:magnesium-translocating P-type ATPase [Candidatus Paceibacterota bacterium]